MNNNRQHGPGRQEAQFLAALLGQLEDYVFAWDRQGQFIYANQKLEKLMGQSLETVCGKTLAQLGAPQLTVRLFQQQISEVMEKRQAVSGHFACPWPSGETVHYEYVLTPVLDIQGEVDFIAGVSRDITERMQVEQALKEADRRKDEFLAILAHELRNPLAAIRTGLEIVSLASEDPGLRQPALDTIDRQSQQLVRLVDDLLEVSRVSQGKTQLNIVRISLAEVIRNAVEALAPLIKEAGQSLTVELPEEDIELEADPHRLIQVFSNLLDNALKYNQEGGQIRLRVWREGDLVVVAVQDTGIGIAREKQQQIFEIFAQIDRPQVRGYIGLGLGLTLVKSLVEMHGGKIGVYSEGDGKGSTFSVQLPAPGITEASAEGEAEGQDKGALQPSRARVLVVDDNKDAAQMLATLTQMLGCEVATAYSGREAVEVAVNFKPGLILMDLGMPEMDGFEAARRIQEQGREQQVRIVALSGWGQDEDRRRTKQAGFAGHLVKPVEAQVLRDLLASLA